MARPLKDGIDYFPLDVGFLRDKKTKLIKGEFGAKGVIVLLQLLCSAYEESGYFKKWDEDDCFLMSDGVGCGVSPELIREIVEGCVKRSIFDERVFNMFGILTSRGIQRRYLRAVSTRDEIELYQEYWLLDINDKKDVPAGISKKLTFKSVSEQNNQVNLQNNSINLQNYPQTKEEKTKEKKTKEEKSYSDLPLDKTFQEVFEIYERHGFEVNGFTAQHLTELLEAYPANWVIEAIKRASERKTPKLKYMRGILKSWKTAGEIDDSISIKKAEQQARTYECEEGESF